MTTNEQQGHKTCYFGLDYRSYKTELFMDRIKRLVKHYFPENKLIAFYRHAPNLLSKISSRIKSKNNFTETGIYKIPCKDCDKYYIGETGRSLGLRIKEHTNMKDVNKSAVANQISDWPRNGFSIY